MFKAVRDSILGMGRRIGGAWQELRAKGMVTLFLFELAVVVSGVLIAQGLANWSNRNATTDKARDTLAVYDRELAQGLDTAHIRLAADSCLVDRVEVIMANAAAGEAMTTRELERPGFWSTLVRSPGEDAYNLIRREKGDENLRMLTLAEARINIIGDLDLEIAREWNHFKLLDPRLGPVSRDDVAAARRAGATILSHLTTIERAAGAIVEELEPLGYEAKSSTVEGGLRGPISTCNDIERYGGISAPLDIPPARPDSAPESED